MAVLSRWAKSRSGGAFGGTSRRTACVGGRRFSGGGPLRVAEHFGNGGPDTWPVHAAFADWPGRNGKRVVGRTQRRAFRAASGGEVPQPRADGESRRGTF